MDNQTDIKLAPNELTINEILQKEFHNKMRGYDPEEVDSFLDIVIKDYQNYEETLANLTTENTRLFNKVEELNQQLSATENIKEVAPNTTSNSSATNYDILKRLSNLEKHVFGAKLSNQTTVEETVINNDPEI